MLTFFRQLMINRSALQREWMEALSRGQWDLAYSLLQEHPQALNLEASLKNGRPLTLAVRGHQPAMVQLLLESGAHLEPTRSFHGVPYSPLGIATVLNDEPCARLLLQHGARPFMPAPSHPGDLLFFKTNFLKNAFDHRNVSLWNLLVEFGAPLDDTVYLGRLLLTELITLGEWQWVQRLIDAGANPHLLCPVEKISAVQMVNQIPCSPDQKTIFLQTLTPSSQRIEPHPSSIPVEQHIETPPSLPTPAPSSTHYFKRKPSAV